MQQYNTDESVKKKKNFQKITVKKETEKNRDTELGWVHPHSPHVFCVAIVDRDSGEGRTDHIHTHTQNKRWFSSTANKPCVCMYVYTTDIVSRKIARQEGGSSRKKKTWNLILYTQ
jgi:hypothetical protein